MTPAEGYEIRFAHLAANKLLLDVGRANAAVASAFTRAHPHERTRARFAKAIESLLRSEKPFSLADLISPSHRSLSSQITPSMSFVSLG